MSCPSSPFSVSVPAMPRGMSWHDYNDSLVERGRVLFDLGFGRHWNDEQEGMNSEKRGRPYEFPDSYIEFLSFFRVGLNTPYRVIEGMTEALSEYFTLVKEIHFTQVRRRILAMVRGRSPSTWTASPRESTTTP